MNKLYKRVILSIAYFPPVEWFAALINAESHLIEQWEHYQKQSYRSRLNILTSSGPLALSIPLKRDITHKLPIKEIEIDNSYSWIVQHKRSITAAYNSSPFFEYYKDDLFPILDSGYKYLFDLNVNLIEKLLELLNLELSLNFTDRYIKKEEMFHYETLDLRDTIHPKKESPILNVSIKEKPYYQVFAEKQGFVSNLSILDLLSNEGPNAISFLLP